MALPGSMTIATASTPPPAGAEGSTPPAVAPEATPAKAVADTGEAVLPAAPVTLHRASVVSWLNEALLPGHGGATAHPLA